MKNANPRWDRFKEHFKNRWAGEDYPKATPRFQVKLFGKDVAVFVLLPILSIVLFKSCEKAFTREKPNSTKNSQKDIARFESSKSQIIDFVSGTEKDAFPGIVKKAPGSLVRAKLLNSVETYSSVPVHAQIIDEGLGKNLVGGTLIGDGTPDANFERINIVFHFALDPNRASVAVPIAARALSLDGTFGVEAVKKEGFLGRAAIGSVSPATSNMSGKGDTSDFKDILLKALTAGLIQEFGSTSQVEKNRSQVLTIQPLTEFMVELTDFFPGGTK